MPFCSFCYILNTRFHQLDEKTHRILSKRKDSFYPGCEVHSCSSVQQQGGDIHVTIVSGDVQRGEPTLFETKREEGAERWREGRGNS